MVVVTSICSSNHELKLKSSSHELQQRLSCRLSPSSPRSHRSPSSILFWVGTSFVPGRGDTTQESVLARCIGLLIWYNEVFRTLHAKPPQGLHDAGMKWCMP